MNPLARLVPPGSDPADLVTAQAEAVELLAVWTRRPEWMDRAACRGEGVAAFFPTRGQSTEAALLVCGSCPVQFACLSYALDDDTLVGIWGGTTEQERRKIRKAAG